jgi:hypothetical protein
MTIGGVIGISRPADGSFRERVKHPLPISCLPVEHAPLRREV